MRSGCAEQKGTYGGGGLEDVVIDEVEDDPQAGPVEVEREVFVDGKMELREELGPREA